MIAIIKKTTFHRDVYEPAEVRLLPRRRCLGWPVVPPASRRRTRCHTSMRPMRHHGSFKCLLPNTNTVVTPPCPAAPQDSFALVDALAAHRDAWRERPPRL